MQANIDQSTIQPEFVLESTIGTEEATEEFILEARTFNPTKEQEELYRANLALLSEIHIATMHKVNDLREGKLVGFFMPEDKYDPETLESSNLLALYLQDKVA